LRRLIVTPCQSRIIADILLSETTRQGIQSYVGRILCDNYLVRLATINLSSLQMLYVLSFLTTVCFQLRYTPEDWGQSPQSNSYRVAHPGRSYAAIFSNAIARTEEA
jgi:hypothetical protein